MATLTKSTNKFAETRIDDEVVLMHVDTGHFHALKDTGLAIWDLIDGTRDEAAICAELQRQFDVSADECSREVHQFTSDLRSAGFLG